MPFSLNGNSVPSIRSYHDALAKWEAQPDFTKGVGHMRSGSKPLSPYRHKTHLVIRKESNGDIALRYHLTDVVTYHPNGDFTVEGYGSMSTNTFLERTTPSGAQFNCTDNTFSGYLAFLTYKPQESEYLWDDHMMCYRFTMRTRFKLSKPWASMEPAYWVPVDPTPNFEIPIFSDTAMTRKILKDAGFYDFKHWYHARCALLNTDAEPRSAYEPEPEDVVEWLKTTGYWSVLARVEFNDTRSDGPAWGRHGKNNEPANLRRIFLEHVRQRVLKHHRAIAIAERRTLTYNELNKARKDIAKCKWMFA